MAPLEPDAAAPWLAALAEARAARADSQRRLRDLVEASGDVLASPRVSDVLAAVLSVAGRILQADGFAIWRLEDGGPWQIRAHAGVSMAFANRTIATPQHAPAAPIPFAEPLVVEDVH